MGNTAKNPNKKAEACPDSRIPRATPFPPFASPAHTPRMTSSTTSRARWNAIYADKSAGRVLSRSSSLWRPSMLGTAYRAYAGASPNSMLTSPVGVITLAASNVAANVRDSGK